MHKNMNTHYNVFSVQLYNPQEQHCHVWAEKSKLDPTEPVVQQLVIRYSATLRCVEL